MTIQELISRLERATEGSAELDALIGVIVGAFDKGELLSGQHFHHDIEDDASVNSYVVTDGRFKRYAHACPKPYTTSADVALSLVREHHIIYRMTLWPGDPEGAAFAEIWGTHAEPGETPDRWHSPKDGRWTARANTLPLALCSAALRARSSHLGRARVDHIEGEGR